MTASLMSSIFLPLILLSFTYISFYNKRFAVPIEKDLFMKDQVP